MHAQNGIPNSCRVRPSHELIMRFVENNWRVENLFQRFCYQNTNVAFGAKHIWKTTKFILQMQICWYPKTQNQGHSCCRLAKAFLNLTCTICLFVNKFCSLYEIHAIVSKRAKMTSKLQFLNLKWHICPPYIVCNTFSTNTVFKYHFLHLTN